MTTEAITSGTEAHLAIADPYPVPQKVSIDRASRLYLPVGTSLKIVFDGVEQFGVIEYDMTGTRGRIRRVNHKNPVSRSEFKNAPWESGDLSVVWRAPPSRQLRRQLDRFNR